MPIVRDTLVDQLAVDFAHACAELEHAHQQLRLEDTTAHRAAVAEWTSVIDVVLDMFLQTVRPTGVALAATG
ncbi:hypothetical protein ACI797_11740 [Geodermatophilus sp. SYSU D00691]